MPSPTLILALLLALCFSLSTWLEPRFSSRFGERRESGNVMAVLMGDGRRLFANHFFAKADAYFHSGYYPSIFHQHEPHVHTHGDDGEPHSHSPEAGHEHSKHDPANCPLSKVAHCPVCAASSAREHSHSHDEEESHGFLGKPRDWLDKFSRSFYLTDHTHLENGKEREILPWLRLSAELDPHRVESYTVAAHWLRTRLGRDKEAEQFLREGLRANPDSHEILFELGQVFYENRKDAERARNLWELAWDKWMKHESGKEEPDLFLFQRLTGSLARLEEQAGNLEQAIVWFERLKAASVNPKAVQEQIDDLKKRLPTAEAAPAGKSDAPPRP